MEILLSFFHIFQKAFFSVGPFFILLGVLIFIHELGHFLVARYFDVKVEVFSLGFGPKLLKYKKGDTVYCLSLLPLGGYVKMFGDNPLEEIPDSEKSRGFLYKKVPQKWLIAFGGPFMNLIFTLLAFFILSISGRPSLPAELGDVAVQSQAYKQGFRSGDKVLSVNGKDIVYYEQLSEIIKNKIDENFLFKVQSSKTNKVKTLTAVTTKQKNPNVLEWKKSIGTVEGLSPLSRGLRVGVLYNSPAYKAGLRTFDEIVKINGKKLRYWRDLQSFIKKEKSYLLSLSIKRGIEEKDFKIKKVFSSLVLLGLEPADIYIERIGPGTPAEQAGLLKGDRLVSINGKSIKGWKQILDTINSYSGTAFSIKYQRQGKQKEVSLSPKPLFVEGNIKKRFMLGVASGGMQVLPEDILRKRSFFQSILYSGQETGSWLVVIAVGLVRLFQGEISLRTMGGPVQIGRIAHSSFHQGFLSFLFIMALISLNLFFLNLLPIPMLDGGHILFFTIEGILGRPLSVKKLLVAQQIGLVVLLSFMGFVVFNDIYNWFQAW